MATMAAILDFRLERFCLFIYLILKSHLCFLQSFKSVGLSVQEEKRKIDFQDKTILYSDRTILAILIYKSP